MTEPQTPGRYEVVIPDHVMEQINGLPPEAVDDFAAAIAALKDNPMGAMSRAVLPFPVDYTQVTERVYVPAARSVSYLRGSVADISPQTVAVFDQELREDVTGDTPQIRIHSLRTFLLRWIEYIAIYGDPRTGRQLAASTDIEEYGQQFAQAMDRVHREEFPDSADESLAVRTFTDGTQWQSICPITMIRVSRPTEEEAELALKMALLELVTGY